MAGSSVPMELLLLALVGLISFGAGWWLRRGRNGDRESADGSGPTAIVHANESSAAAGTVGAEPEAGVEPGAVATLAVASEAIQHLQGLPPCPTCGSRMELREFNGKKIWICEDFPVCRGAQLQQ